jgi:hypothetical protein
MHIKWYLAGRVPWPRIDHWPQLLHLGGIAVLAFELSFVVLIWFRGGRICAALAGLAFHFFAAYFMYIHFVGLWGCYVVLWDGPRSSQLPQRSTSRVGAWLALMAGTCLTMAVLTQGVRGQTQAWPFACYPDFAHRPARHVTDLAVEFETKDGSFRTWRPSRARSARDWGTVWRILGLYDGRVDRAALLAYARRGARQAHLEGALAHPPQVRIYSEDYSTAPEAYGDAPLRRRLLFTHHGF